MKRLKILKRPGNLSIKRIGLLCGLVLVTAGMGLPAKSYALFEGAKNQACAGVNLNATQTTCTDSSDSLTNKVGVAINIISVIVGIIAVIMIIVGGLKFITAAGDAGGVASARNTILYSVVGLVVVAMAQVVVRFVLFRVTKK